MPADKTIRPVSPPLPDIMVIPAMTKEELFDHIAREHDGFAFTNEDAPRVHTLRHRLGDIGGLHVVEPGCGSGHLTAHLAQWVGDAGQIVAFDSSAGMIDKTRARTAGLPQVSVRHAALETIELPDGRFDRVICFRVWPHFEDPDLALATIARWLRPGGRLLIVHWDSRETLNTIHAAHHAVVADVFPPRPTLEAALGRHGFTLRAWIDTAEEIFIEASTGGR